MTTTQIIQVSGALPVLMALLLSLAVTLLRLAAFPFAGVALALDKAADFASRPLTLPTPAPKEETR